MAAKVESVAEDTADKEVVEKDTTVEADTSMKTWIQTRLEMLMSLVSIKVLEVLDYILEIIKGIK